MRAKSLVLIAIALTCGLVASVGISQVLNKKPETEKVVEETVNIFVATRDIDINEKVSADNVRLEPWPKGRVPEGAILDIKELEGKFARTRLYNGEVVNAHKLMDTSGGLSEVIPAGYRVASVRVTMETAVSNLLKPGDRVDILAVLRRGRDVPQTMTKRVLEAVRIFAVNSETERRVDQNGAPIDAKTVSVLVTNKQVPRLLMAHSLGELRLTLRGPDLKAEEENEVEDDYHVDQFLTGEAEFADDESRFEEGEGNAEAEGNTNGGFSQFLQSGQQTAQQIATTQFPVDTKPKFTMTVMTPNGKEKFAWDETTEQFVPAGSAGLAAPIQSSLPIEEGVENPPTDDDVKEETQNEETSDAPRPS